MSSNSSGRHRRGGRKDCSSAATVQPEPLLTNGCPRKKSRTATPAGERARQLLADMRRHALEHSNDTGGSGQWQTGNSAQTIITPAYKVQLLQQTVDMLVMRELQHRKRNAASNDSVEQRPCTHSCPSHSAPLQGAAWDLEPTRAPPKPNHLRMQPAPTTVGLAGHPKDLGVSTGAPARAAVCRVHSHHAGRTGGHPRARDTAAGHERAVQRAHTAEQCMPMPFGVAPTAGAARPEFLQRGSHIPALPSGKRPHWQACAVPPQQGSKPKGLVALPDAGQWPGCHGGHESGQGLPGAVAPAPTLPAGRPNAHYPSARCHLHRPAAPNQLSTAGPTGRCQPTGHKVAPAHMAFPDQYNPVACAAAPSVQGNLTHSLNAFPYETVGSTLPAQQPVKAGGQVPKYPCVQYPGPSATQPWASNMRMGRDTCVQQTSFQAAPNTDSLCFGPTWLSPAPNNAADVVVNDDGRSCRASEVDWAYSPLMCDISEDFGLLEGELP